MLVLWDLDFFINKNGGGGLRLNCEKSTCFSITAKLISILPKEKRGRERKERKKIIGGRRGRGEGGKEMGGVGKEWEEEVTLYIKKRIPK